MTRVRSALSAGAHTQTAKRRIAATGLFPGTSAPRTAKIFASGSSARRTISSIRSYPDSSSGSFRVMIPVDSSMQPGRRLSISTKSVSISFMVAATETPFRVSSERLCDVLSWNRAVWAGNSAACASSRIDAALVASSPVD